MDTSQIITINNIAKLCTNNIYIDQQQNVLSSIQWLDHQLDYLLRLTGLDTIDTLTGLPLTNLQKGRAIQQYYQTMVEQVGPDFCLRSAVAAHDFEKGILLYNDGSQGVPETPFTCTDTTIEDPTIRFLHRDSYKACPDCTFQNSFAASQCSLCSATLPPSSLQREWHCTTCTLVNAPQRAACVACNTTKP